MIIIDKKEGKIETGYITIYFDVMRIDPADGAYRFYIVDDNKIPVQIARITPNEYIRILDGSEKVTYC